MITQESSSSIDLNAYYEVAKEACKHKVKSVPNTAHAVAFCATVDALLQGGDMTLPTKHDADSLVARALEPYVNDIIVTPQ